MERPLWAGPIPRGGPMPKKNAPLAKTMIPMQKKIEQNFDFDFLVKNHHHLTASDPITSLGAGGGGTGSS